MCEVYLILAFCALVVGAAGDDCRPRDVNGGSVCVCDSKYCDTVPPLSPSLSSNPTSEGGKYQIYTTSKSRLGFRTFRGDFIKKPPKDSSPAGIELDRTRKYQRIIGFGGAFTDSFGINTLSLPQEAQTKLLDSYFGPDGSGYTLCRVPIGGTDFSIRPYSYDDNPDDDGLDNFQLQEEDLEYKIPLIKRAAELRGDGPLRLFASAWTAPPWMKTNNAWTGIGRLETVHYQTWADYHVKFLRNYHANGVEIWGLTTGNEPSDGVLLPEEIFTINSMGWTATTANKWIGENLGPTLRNSSYKDVKIILHDDNRLTLPFVPLLLENEATLEYADGIGVHWYWDDFLPVDFLDYTKTDRKDLFLIVTEACNGFGHGVIGSPAVILGSWERGERYISSIFSYLERNASGWVDWNMALDPEGGPSYVGTAVDSPIIVNSIAGEFYKQPTFYAMGHFAKFVVPDSTRIAAASGIETVDVLAFERPDGLSAVIINNRDSEDLEVEIRDGEISVKITVEANSINTLIY